MKRVKWLTLIILILIPVIGALLVSLLTRGSMEDFLSLNKPPLSPPGWLFPVVWSILYPLMGVASYLVFSTESDINIKAEAMRKYFWQLTFNLLWSIIFFTLGAFWLAFVWIIILIYLLVKTIIDFNKIKKIAAYIMIPYLCWVIFAAYLNLGIAILN